MIIIVSPYIFNLAMAFIVLMDTSMSKHIGIGLLTLGWFVYSLFLAFCHWYYKFVIILDNDNSLRQQHSLRF